MYQCYVSLFKIFENIFSNTVTCPFYYTLSKDGHEGRRERSGASEERKIELKENLRSKGDYPVLITEFDWKIRNTLCRLLHE